MGATTEPPANVFEVKPNPRQEEPGTYRVMVKVIDILGNDTTKTLTVEVGL